MEEPLFGEQTRIPADQRTRLCCGYTRPMSVVKGSFDVLVPGIATVAVLSTENGGSVFTVTLSPALEGTILCSCRDPLHSSKGIMCEHCCYLLAGVAGQTDAAVYRGDRAARVRALYELWDELVCSLESRAGRKDTLPADTAAECPVCYEAFGAERCVECGRCANTFHRACAARWGRSCPTCRDQAQFCDLAGEHRASFVNNDAANSDEPEPVSI